MPDRRRTSRGFRDCHKDCRRLSKPGGEPMRDSRGPSRESTRECDRRSTRRMTCVRLLRVRVVSWGGELADRFAASASRPWPDRQCTTEAGSDSQSALAPDRLVASNGPAGRRVLRRVAAHMTGRARPSQRGESKAGLPCVLSRAQNRGVGFAPWRGTSTIRMAVIPPAGCLIKDHDWALFGA
jgi:hypothetical protein